MNKEVLSASLSTAVPFSCLYGGTCKFLVDSKGFMDSGILVKHDLLYLPDQAKNLILPKEVPNLILFCLYLPQVLVPGSEYNMPVLVQV